MWSYQFGLSSKVSRLLIDDGFSRGESHKTQLSFPRNVFPGYREVMVLENTHPMIGTCGTLSWQLVEINLRLIVMWRSIIDCHVLFRTQCSFTCNGENSKSYCFVFIPWLKHACQSNYCKCMDDSDNFLSVPFNFNIRDSYYAIGLARNKGKFPNSAYW